MQYEYSTDIIDIYKQYTFLLEDAFQYIENNTNHCISARERINRGLCLIELYIQIVRQYEPIDERPKSIEILI